MFSVLVVGMMMPLLTNIILIIIIIIMIIIIISIIIITIIHISMTNDETSITMAPPWSMVR